MQGKRLFIWDFHGTLEFGCEKAALIISNKVLRDNGYSERFTEQDAFNLNGIPWYEWFAHLLPDEPETLHKSFQAQAVSDRYIEDQFSHLTTTPYASEVLNRIEESQHDQIVISATSTRKLPMFLHAAGLDSFFDEETMIAVVNEGVPVVPKKLALRRFINKQRSGGIIYSGLITIGDSVGDVGLKWSINEIAYQRSYCFAHKDRPFRAQADYQIRDLRDILREI